MARKALPLALLVCVVLAGCTLLPSETGPGEPLVTVSATGCAEGFEEGPPSSPTAETAKSFAIECETSRIVSPDGYVARGTTILARSESGFYVRTTVMAGTETGSSSGIYFVGRGTYERIAADHRSIDGYFHSENPGENAKLNAYLLNFGDRTREYRLTLTYLNNSSRGTVFDRPYSVPAGGGVSLHPVTMRVGAYNATLWENGDRIRGWQFRLTENRTGDVLIVVEPNGELMVNRTEAGRFTPL